MSRRFVCIFFVFHVKLRGTQEWILSEIVPVKMIIIILVVSCNNSHNVAIEATGILKNAFNLEVHANLPTLQFRYLPGIKNFRRFFGRQREQLF